MDVRVRAVTEDDTAAVAGLLQSASHRTPTEAWQSVRTLGRVALVQLGAEVDGRLVGWAALAKPPALPPGTVALGGGVEPTHRRRGVGTALWDALVGDVPQSCDRLMTFSDDRDDEASLPWLRARHFEPFQHSITSGLDLSAWRGGAPPPADVTVRVVDPETTRGNAAVAELYERSDTSPEADEIGAMTWEQELDMAEVFGGGEAVLAIAERENRPVALAFAMNIEGTHVWQVHYTGVDPEHRGSGLGAVVKTRLHDEVVRRGGARLETDNEATNAGIRHVNEQLGYVKQSGTRRHRRDLTLHPLP
jgi:GNAT superfamily N-acetyltransferase